MSKQKTILNIGHPRTGTGYMAKLYQAAGLDVEHEGIGKDGTSCWTFAVSDESWFKSWKGTRNDYEWKYIIHNIRDPNDALPSIFYAEDMDNTSSVEFRRKHLNINTNLSKLSQSIQSFLGWNKLIQSLELNLKVKVENCVEKVEKFLKEKNLSKSINRDKLPSKDYNSRSYSDNINSRMKDNVPKKLRDKLNDWCRDHNYDPFFK